ncbi:MAG: pimeloyl-ACP methyl ester esterase BioH [Methylococcales bacterium]
MSSIHQQRFGAGKPIVLVHGWAMHGGIWRSFAEQLAEKYQVICVDLPGHGNSQALQNFVLADVSAAVVAALAEPDACWLGWSLGTTVVLDIVDRYPERVNSLILLSGNPHFVQSPVWPGMAERVLDNFAASLYKDCQITLMRFLSLQVNQDLPEHKALLKELRTAVLSCPAPDFKTLLGGLQILKTADMRTSLAKANKPTAVILGDRDTLVPVAVGQAMQSLAAIELHILKKGGHVPFLSHARELREIIFRFLE